jgi:hypothetical protein
MTSTRSRLLSPRSACLALLALASLGCQSGGAGGTDTETDDGSEAGTARELAASNAVVSVRERASGQGASDAPDAGGGLEPAPERAAADAEPTAPVATFAACLSNGDVYSDCETIFVTVVEASPERCIQLTIDNCGTYDRQGLSADTPTSWRLASGSVGSDADSCELGTFYPGTRSLSDATGSITWDEAAPNPTDVAFDLTLELPAVAGQAQTIELTTLEPLQPTGCEE